MTVRRRDKRRQGRRNRINVTYLYVKEELPNSRRGGMKRTPGRGWWIGTSF